MPEWANEIIEKIQARRWKFAPDTLPVEGACMQWANRMNTWCTEIAQKVAEKHKDGWIPVTWHETTDEDGIDKFMYPTCLDCRMPYDGQEIIVCSKRNVWLDTCYIDDGYSLDSGNDWVDDIVAWRPLPEPYKENA